MKEVGLTDCLLRACTMLPLFTRYRCGDLGGEKLEPRKGMSEKQSRRNERECGKEVDLRRHGFQTGSDGALATGAVTQFNERKELPFALSD